MLSSMSFAEYKIDYNNYLGFGVFGSVYGVVPRPINEQGFFSYYFPYIYDYLFRANFSDSASAKYCVKISKTTLRILYEIIKYLEDLFPLKPCRH